jgi:hypothetical protein
MLFSKNISSLTILEAELIRLKAMYVQALETKNEATIKTLRKTIKSLKSQMTITSNGTISVSE